MKYVKFPTFSQTELPTFATTDAQGKLFIFQDFELGRASAVIIHPDDARALAKAILGISEPEEVRVL